MLALEAKVEEGVEEELEVGVREDADGANAGGNGQEHGPVE